MRAAAEEAARRARVAASFKLREGYPAVVSDPEYVSRFVRAVQSTSLAAGLQAQAAPSMVIEDFSYFLQRWPGTMVYLGAQVEGHSAFNHADDVVFSEDAMATGTALYLLAADGV